jgi:tetratricopeptide (TPR) repeat protein
MTTGEVTTTFATLLRQHRLAAGLTQDDLAERAGLSVRAISDLERGIKRPRMDTVALLVTGLALDESARSDFERASRRPFTEPAEYVAPARPNAPDALPTGGYLGAMPAFPLVGRQAEIARLTSALEAARGGAGRFVLLTGEPGVGKTRLAQELMLQARAGGWLTLVGRCYEEHERTPYFPFRQALAAGWDAASSALRQNAPQRFLALGRLLPEVLPAPPLEGEAEARLGVLGAVAGFEEARLRVLRAVAGFLAAVADEQPVLVLLDDLHWADENSLDVLQHLVRFARGQRLLLLGTYRDVEVGRQHPLAQTLAQLVREQLAETLPLRPLSMEGTAALIGAQIGQEAVAAEQRAAIHARTAGNPFFTIELLAALAEQGAFARADEGRARNEDPGVLPESIRSLVEQRVGRLATGAQEMLQLASVLGQEFDLEVLLTAADEPEDIVLEQVEVALAARLLEERQVGHSERYAFTHALIAQVLHDELPRFRRRRLHLQVAGVLERLRGGEAGAAAEIGRHWLAGGNLEHAATYLERAGDQARAQQGREAAAGWYREVVELLAGLGRPLDTARVREKLGSLLSVVGRYTEALTVLEPAAETYRAAGDLEGAGRVVALIASVYYFLVMPGEGLACVEPMLTLLAPRGPSPALAALYIGYSFLLNLLGHFAEGLAAAEEAERICRVVGDDRQLADALTARGETLSGFGRFTEAVQTLFDASRAAEAAGDLYAQCGALFSLGHAQQESGSFVASKQSRERVLYLAERHGFPIGVTSATTALGWLAFLGGDWAVARQRMERAVAFNAEIGPSAVTWPWPHQNLAALCLAEGADAEALRHLEECERTQHVEEFNLRLRVQALHAERDLLAGQPEEAQRRLSPLLETGAAPGAEPLDLLHLMAWARLDLGEVPAAAKLATRAVATARERGARLVLVDALRVAALAEVRQQRWDSAERTLQEGLSLAQEIGYPYAEGKLLHVYGMLHARQGQPAQARERLEAARAIFRRLGARKDLERTEYLLSTMVEERPRSK